MKRKLLSVLSFLFLAGSAFAQSTPVWLNFADYGAKGDGLNDDTSALNAGLAASGSTGKPICAWSTAKFLVSYKNTKIFDSGGSLITRSYAVQIPSGARVDWQGATIQGGTGAAYAQGCLLVNGNMSTVGNQIECRNLIVDGGGRTDTARAMPLVWFYGLKNSDLRNVKAQNCSYCGMQISNCSQSTFNGLDCQSINGQGVLIGGNTPALGQISDCIVGTCWAQDVKSLGTTSQQGNGFCVGAVRTRIASLVSRNCGGGNKFQPGCLDVVCDLSEFDGTVLTGESSNSTGNSGTKVQGDVPSSTSAPAPDRVSITRVISRNCGGAGLYVWYAGNVRIGSYEGFNNGNAGTNPDVSSGFVTGLQIGSSSIRSSQ